jgi:hypothetical protein
MIGTSQTGLQVPTQLARYETLGLTAGPFESVGIFAPVRRGETVLLPDVGTRSQGVTAYCWSFEEFCRERFLRFLFADADQETSHLAAVIDRVEVQLANEDVSSRGHRRVDDFGLAVHSYMGLHPEIPLIAFLRLVHFRIVLLLSVFGRGRRMQDGRVHDRAGGDAHSAGLQV